jgi:carbon monoxide dehydrogenase subunit G
MAAALVERSRAPKDLSDDPPSADDINPVRFMREFISTIDIGAPPKRVWQVMSGIDQWHEWTPSVTSVKRLGGEPFAVGSKVLIRQPKLPPALWTVTAIEPERSFTWVSKAPGLRAVGRHALVPTADGSRATLSLQFHGMFGGVFARMLKGITERYVAQEAKGLKARSESPEFRHGDGRR